MSKLKLLKKTRKLPKKSDYSQKLYLSVKEAAAYSGLAEYYIRKLIADNKVPYVETGVKFLINRIALEEYLKSQEH